MLSFQAYLDVVLYVVLLIFGSGLAVSIPLALIYKRFQPGRPFENSVLIVAFALVGGVIGLCTGASREASASSVIPAVLTLVAGIFAYAFTKETQRAQRAVVPYLVMAFITMMIFWICIGGKYRFEYEVWVRNDERELLRFQKVTLELEKALAFKEKGLPLPTESPKPNTSPEPLKSGLPTPTKSEQK